MWDRVIARYGNHPNAYFEVINEPNGFSYSDLNGVYFDTIDYNIPTGSYFADYIRGVARKMRSLGVGSVCCRVCGTVTGTA